MGHQPTIFYILENQTLGTWWVGKIESTLDGYGMCPYRSITQDQLNEKLSEKYHNPNAYLTLVTLNKRWNACYGVERWLSKLEYKISKEPEKYQELEELLKAGWDDDIETSTLSVLHVLEHNQPVDKIFKKLVTSREGLTRCLNTYTGKTRAEKYQESKKDPEFMYKRARKEVLRQMEKTGKLPKPETLAKYEIKEDCYINYMEEIPCEPCEKEFYKKGKIWYCLCNKRTITCSNFKCKEEGLRLGLKVGGSICEHDRYRSSCKECGGGAVCEHNKVRSICKECGGGRICEHNRQRSQCKECGGSQICKHNRYRSICKECGGSQICQHNRIFSQCKECGGGSICQHNRIFSHCKECGGGSICEHNRERARCKPCGGSQICEHNKVRSVCKECGGGSICEHNRFRSTCKECGGGKICEHSRQRRQCKICDPRGHITNLRRSRRSSATRSPNSTRTLDDLCMTTREWLKYLHKTFEDTYGRPKTEEDEVHIDEIIPCSAWDLPNDNKYCWHYLNSQWLLAEDNLSKSDSYDEGDKLAMIERIQSS
jgi:hypothetical protein